MTGPEMVKYINHLSSSGRTQSIDANFGVGAKISAATRNHCGVIYLSWKDSIGTMIHLWRNPIDGTYGLRPLPLEDGKYGSWAPIDDALKPKQIKDHGTVVILLGNDEDEDTMVAPTGTPTPSRWIARYLNSRFFQFPDGLTVRSREGWTSENPDTTVARQVKGSKEFLEKHMESSGSVDLDNAIARWWILADSASINQSSGANLTGGHAAALFQNELYELQAGRAGTALLQKFGVLVGHRRVVVYVEPKNIAGTLTANTARTHLLLDGESLPWSEWAETFRQNFPVEIKAMMNAIADDGNSDDHEKSIQDRLKDIADLYRLKKYRPSQTGRERINSTFDRGAEETPSTRSRKVTERGPGTLNRSGSQSRNVRTKGDIYTLFLKKGGAPGEELKDHVDIKVRWVAATEFEPEDRAAHYQSEARTLLINRDFRVFTCFIERWQERYSQVPGAAKIIRDAVHEWFEQTLREVIYSAEHLRGDLEWTDDAMSQLLSDEALTAAVLPRYHTEMAVRKTLGIKLGSIKDKQIA
ncbi:hypothetical protein KF913_22670 [Candidatus Obscuribacterales bacterium]|nr:hypothetical protein [Candidatus Obscuribacterales bacterium]